MSDKKPDPRSMHPADPSALLRVRFRSDVQIPPNIISYWTTEPSKKQGVTMRAAPDGIIIESDKSDDFEDVVPWSNVSSYRRVKVK